MTIRLDCTEIEIKHFEECFSHFFVHAIKVNEVQKLYYLFYGKNNENYSFEADWS